MTQTRPLPLNEQQAVAISKLLLTHPEFGLKTTVSDPDDLELVDQCLQLLDRVEQTDREDWTEIKRLSMRRVSSPPADAISRIASGMRTPDVYLSALRDAAEKVVEIATEHYRQKAGFQVQRGIQGILDRA